MKTSRKQGLAVLICTSLGLWALMCFLVHGAAIFAYVGLQAATSGVFAYSLWRIERGLPVKKSLARKSQTTDRVHALPATDQTKARPTAEVVASHPVVPEKAPVWTASGRE